MVDGTCISHSVALRQWSLQSQLFPAAHEHLPALTTSTAPRRALEGAGSFIGARMYAPYHPAVRPSLCAWFVMFLKLGKRATLTIGLPLTARTSGARIYAARTQVQKGTHTEATRTQRDPMPRHMENHTAMRTIVVVHPRRRVLVAA